LHRERIRQIERDSLAVLRGQLEGWRFRSAASSTAMWTDTA